MSSSNRNPPGGASTSDQQQNERTIAPAGAPAAVPQQQSSSSIAAVRSSTAPAPRQALHVGANTRLPIGAVPFGTATGGILPNSTTATRGLSGLAAAASAAAASPMALPPFAATRDAHNMMHTNNSTHTPAIFLNRKLRAGKWIVEEEKYAEVLIELFEKGLVARCENGSTLRAYLSQKLHCAPMRISKKFAGKGIGKMVYLSKMKAGASSLTEEERGELLNRVKAAEDKFYRAVFPNNDSLLAPLGTLLPPSLGGVAPFPMIQGVVPLFPQATPGLPLALPAPPFAACVPPNALLAPHTSAPRAPGNTPAPAPVTSVATQQIKPNAAVAPATSHAAVASSGEHGATTTSSDAEKLRQSFLSALHQTQGAGQVAAAAQAVPNQGVSGPPSASIDYRKLPPSSSSTDHRQWTAPVAGGKPLHPGNSLPIFPVKHPGDPGAALSAPASGQVAADSQVKALATELPDFLSGFDKATKNAKPASSKEQASPNGAPQQPNLQYSPPFTSRSFDDFHRFLGKDAMPLGGEEAQTSKLVADKNDDASKPDTMALFTAESYALFAQESALAASQHDAYLPPSAVSATTTHSHGSVNQHQQQKSTSFDIDGMVKLVSEHVSHHHQEQQQQTQQGAAPVPVYSAPSESAATTATQQPVHIQPRNDPPQPPLPPPPPTTTMDTSKGGTMSNPPTYMNFVSGSEQSDPSSSGVTEAEMSSVRGSTSESAGGTTGGSDNTSNESEGSSSDSDEGTKRTGHHHHHHHRHNSNHHHHPSTTSNGAAGDDDWNKKRAYDGEFPDRQHGGGEISETSHLRKKLRPGS